MNSDIVQLMHHTTVHGGVVATFTVQLLSVNRAVRAAASLLRSYRALLVQVRKAAEETARFVRWARGRWSRR